MRYFKSLGSDGWKSAVLKIKMRKKLPAITITLTAVSIFCFLVLAEAFFMMTSGSFNALAAQRTASQAEQNARIEVKRLENLDYAELSYLAEHPRQVMEGVEDGNWESEVTLGPEKNLSEDDNVKIRLAHVSIYRTQDSVSRYDVDVPLTSATGTTPIGSVMTWTSEGKPTTGGVWLECNGQTIPSKYKRLRELIGNKTPDYRGLFLRGYGSQSATYHQGVRYDRMNMTSTYSSGALGKIQSDATRPFHLHAGQIFGLIDKVNGPTGGKSEADFTYANRPFYRSPTSYWYGRIDAPGAKYDPYEGGAYGDGMNFTTIDNFLFMRKYPKKYRLEGQVSCHCNPESGSCSCSTPRLVEDEDKNAGDWYRGSISQFAAYSDAVSPGANEVRPINIAVKYFIKAR